MFRDPRGEGGDLAVRLLAPFSSARLAPRPDGPLTHFASPCGEKCRLLLKREAGKRTNPTTTGRHRHSGSSASYGAKRPDSAILTCISHHPTVEAHDTTARTSLRLLAVLDVLSSTPARAKRLAPRPDGPLTHFASPRGEKCRLTLFAKHWFDGAQSRLRSPVLLFSAIIRRSVKSACDAKPIMVN